MFFRYHMATRMAAQKNFRHWYMSFVTVGAVVLQVFLCSIMFSTVYFYQSPFGPVISTCLIQNNKTTVPDPDPDPPGLPIFLGPMLVFATGALGLIIDIVFDSAMFMFLRKRKQSLVQPQIAMIAWGPRDNPEPLSMSDTENNPIPFVSLGTKDLKASKATVPIKATCLGLAYLVIVGIVIYFVVFRFGQDIAGRYLFRLCMAGFISCHIPLVLLLTVKSNRKKDSKRRNAVAPPSGLQFHE